MELNQDWFFNQLPAYYHQADSYPNAQGEGLMQRYLKTFAQELNQEFVEKIDNLIQELDPLTCDSSLLNFIAESMGSPPDLFGDEDKYRKFLKVIVSIYQIKGSYCSYYVLFNWLGYNQVAIYEPLLYGVNYDTPVVYDDASITYDSICPPCKPYFIALMPPESPCLPIPSGFSWDLNQFITPEELEKLICFLNPINMSFQKVIPLLSVCETFQTSWLAELIIENITYTSYDSGIDVDDIEAYDDASYSLISSETQSELDSNAYVMLAKNLGGQEYFLDFLLLKLGPDTKIAIPLPVPTEVSSTQYVWDITHTPLYHGPIDSIQLVSSLGGLFLTLPNNFTTTTQDIQLTLNLSVNECA